MLPLLLAATGVWAPPKVELQLPKLPEDPPLPPPPPPVKDIKETLDWMVQDCGVPKKKRVQHIETRQARRARERAYRKAARR